MLKHTPRAALRQRSQPRGDDTRRRLVETAIETFAAFGYEGSSTRLLAERAAVNLPAIQYHFGGKEGLYRAAIAHIVAEIDSRVAPVADRVRGALKRAALSRREVAALLDALLDAFVACVVGEGQGESRKLFINRAQSERSNALAPLHQCFVRQVIGPCAELVARLTGRKAGEERTQIQALAVLGQASIFCNKGPKQVLGWNEIGAKRMKTIQSVVRAQTAAIFREPAGRAR